jgi:hypothetical protein
MDFITSSFCKTIETLSLLVEVFSDVCNSLGNFLGFTGPLYKFIKDSSTHCYISYFVHIC